MRVYYSDALKEVGAFARDLLKVADPAKRWMVPTLKSNLEAIQQQVRPGEQVNWIFGGPAEHEFFRTRDSGPETEAGGLHLAFGFWLTLRQGDAKPRRLSDWFEVLAASTSFIICRADFVCVHRFAIDFQAPGGPGPRLHAQTKGNDENATPVVDVPRFLLPASLPTDAIGLALHEVFPTTWSQELGASADAKIHGPLQSARLSRVLDAWLAGIRGSTDPYGALRQITQY